MIEQLNAYSDQLSFVAATFGLIVAVVLFVGLFSRTRGQCGCLRCQAIRSARERSA